MGRKKKGVLSHDQLVRDLQVEKAVNTLSLKVQGGADQDANEISSKVGLEKAEKVAIVTQPVEVETSSAKDRAYDDEDVFEDIAEVDDDMNELTRLMSCVDIEDNAHEIEEQTSLAGV